MLPDPLHTHSSALFDKLAVAIQQGAQDEKYDFDSSWLPWDDDETSYALLADDKASSLEKEFQEKQPGIILFRKAPACLDGGNCRKDISRLYSGGLIVFVVGEDATHGIHREQFNNALEWIAALHPDIDTKRKRVAILGPTFSGSFPSLAQALSNPEIPQNLHFALMSKDAPLPIFSGSVSGKRPAEFFQKAFGSQMVFHSFVQSDDEILARFSAYMKAEQPNFDFCRVAIVSEDETAYGGDNRDGNGEETRCTEGTLDQHALNLYYPRDISALRAAYQTKSLFDTGTSSQPAQTQRKNLPVDLADPSGKVHDSIHSYGGGQTPLAQEAHLINIVGALRDFHIRYIFLRSSSTLDLVFLANFLRRNYPDGRIVILGSDLTFIRERGSTGLSGAMTLSTYPLFPLARDWTEHQSLPAPDRTFGADSSEGTYISLRLLLNERSMIRDKADATRCQVADEKREIFLPSITCEKEPPIPDYSAPFWTLADKCGELAKTDKNDPCRYAGPAVWLSVIGANRFWPLASLTKHTPNADMAQSKPAGAPLALLEDRKTEPGGLPEMPVEMKILLLALAGFAVFHNWRCWTGSYTAGLGHEFLVLSGSCCVAFSAIVAGWASGIFSFPAAGLPYPRFAFWCVAFAWLMALGASMSTSRTRRERLEASGLFVAATALFFLLFVVPVQRELLPENRVLTYWRAMHLASGISPIVPLFSILAGLYLGYWFTLRGVTLFGPDRPCLPGRELLAVRDEKGDCRYFLGMFSHEDAAAKIEQAAAPWNWKMFGAAAILSVLFGVLAFAIAGGVPIHSLGSESYAIIFVLWLDICCSLLIIETWRLYHTWEELRRLLTFLDRLPLRRTMAALRGFSWGTVWKMSSNVLEVRYKVISRQMECMNHTIERLQQYQEEHHRNTPRLRHLEVTRCAV